MKKSFLLLIIIECLLSGPRHLNASPMVKAGQVITVTICSVLVVVTDQMWIYQVCSEYVLLIVFLYCGILLLVQFGIFLCSGV